MKKIIYFCPQADAPAGGVKVIHRHCELINRLGGSSEVYYNIKTGRAINWFEHNTPIKADNVFNPATDFVFLPEAGMHHFWRELRQLNIDYGIFVQNGDRIRIGLQRRHPLSSMLGIAPGIAMTLDVGKRRLLEGLLNRLMRAKPADSGLSLHDGVDALLHQITSLAGFVSRLGQRDARERAEAHMATLVSDDEPQNP